MMMIMMLIMILTTMMFMIMMLGHNCDPSLAALPSRGGHTGTDREAPGPPSTQSRSDYIIVC